MKAAEGIRTFTRFSKKVVVEINKVGEDRAQRIESWLRILAEYAHEVIRRVLRVVETMRGEKVTHLRKRGEYKHAHVIKHLKERLEANTKLGKRVIYQAQETLRGIHVIVNNSPSP